MTKSTTTETESNPPAWAQPLFETSATDALAAYNSGQGGNTYPYSTVAPLTETTMTGVNQLAQAGQGWNTSAATQPLYQGIAATALSDPYISQIAGSAGSVGSSAGDVTWAGDNVTGAANQLTGVANNAGNVYQSASAPTSAATNLQGYASGEYLSGEGNPFYRKRLEGEIADSNDLLQSAFSGAGRYGSGANQGTIAENTSNMLLAGLEEDYNRQESNMFDANAQIDAAKAQQITSQLGALGLQGSTLGQQGSLYGTAGNLYGTAGNLYGTQGNLYDAASTQYGAGLDRAMTATDAMAAQDQQNFVNQLTGAQATLDAGSILDQQAQALTTDKVNQWYGEDNELWTQLGLLQQAAAGAAGSYGTGTSTQTAPVNAGSLLSGIGSLFSKSDARAKEHIIPLGWFNGFPVYEFSYIGSSERYIGIMAQEVAQIEPDAVEMQDGFLAVHFNRIGVPMTRVWQ